MNRVELEKLLGQVADGEVSPERAAGQLAVAPIRDLGFATVDTQRGIRQGASEVIYGEGKTPEQIAAICSAQLESGQERILVTRVSADKDKAVGQLLEGIAVDYHEEARVEIVGSGMPDPDGIGTIVVVSAGTSDLYVSEEAALTAEFLGNRVTRICDVGVAGLHRLLAHLDELEGASVVVAVAGMEGALASVAGGLVACPVIAVPTSVGYGASFGGLAALLAMMNSCASGVSVVNIDNGFGAGYQASQINHVRAHGA